MRIKFLALAALCALSLSAQTVFYSGKPMSQGVEPTINGYAGALVSVLTPSIEPPITQNYTTMVVSLSGTVPVDGAAVVEVLGRNASTQKWTVLNTANFTGGTFVPIQNHSSISNGLSDYGAVDILPTAKAGGFP